MRTDEKRMQFGYERTTCDCQECTSHCLSHPGYLIPDDVHQMHQAVAPELNLKQFADKYLEPGKGAMVSTGGKPYIIPTIRPATNPENGHCVFLKDGKCSIHAVSPFGCAFFDHSQSQLRGNAISTKGLTAILQEFSLGRIFKGLTDYLYATKQRPKDAYQIPGQAAISDPFLPDTRPPMKKVKM